MVWQQVGKLQGVRLHGLMSAVVRLLDNGSMFRVRLLFCCCLESVFFLCVAQTLMYKTVYTMHTKALVCERLCRPADFGKLVYTLWLDSGAREWAAHCGTLAETLPTPQTMRATHEEVCSRFCLLVCTPHITLHGFGANNNRTLTGKCGMLLFCLAAFVCYLCCLALGFCSIGFGFRFETLRAVGPSVWQR